MVDSIGTKAGAVSDRRTVPVGAAGKVEVVRPVASDTPAVQSAAAEMSGVMASRPPVDAERVARIRQAIDENRFPVSASAIADRMIALEQEWNR